MFRFVFLLVVISAYLYGCKQQSVKDRTAPYTTTQSRQHHVIKKPSVKVSNQKREVVIVRAPSNSAKIQSKAMTYPQWLAQFRQKALSNGIRAVIFDQVMSGVILSDSVIGYDQKQPEFSKSIWQYLDGAVSESRVRIGKEKLNNLRVHLNRIENQYGVDAEVILAIWGMESGYGANYGNFSTINALASLAYDGRRREFAENELVAALKIIQSGDVSRDGLIGSWAGAMGHTQFMPSSYQRYAVDFTGDGRRDIWSDNPVDALASTANYLASFGWRLGQPWGLEVRLPANFDYFLADQSLLKPVVQWNALGVRQINGSPIPNYGNASILVPAGVNGPKFILFNNFSVIKRYNNSTSYAMAVGSLANRINGGGLFIANWPRYEQPLSRSEKKLMQRLLTAKGFDTQGVDGVIGSNTQRAIKAFQRKHGVIADGYANKRLLSRLQFNH